MDREESDIRVYSSHQPTEPEKMPIPLKVTLTIKVEIYLIVNLMMERIRKLKVYCLRAWKRMIP
jgi:hypothetical protein